MSSPRSRGPTRREMQIERLEDRRLLAGNPVITEFMASNRSFLDDGDGNSSDWIEVYNPGYSPIDLAGYRLTDKPDDPSRWTFPSITVEPNGYLVVFASSQDVDNYVDAEGQLHTNFALDADGEYLALVAPEGRVVSEFGSTGTDYWSQRADLSYGLAQSLTLVARDSDTFYRVPVDGSDDATWIGPNFDEKERGFSLGHAALGMDADPARGGDFSAEIVTVLPPRSYGVYTRTHFELDDASSVRDLILRVTYDNGFAAYLNGHPVATDNAPDNLAWYTTATESALDDRLAAVSEDFVLSEHIDKLVAGDNVLAIHGLNHFPADQDDMILAFELEAVVPSVAVSGYMPEPTPGSANRAVFSGLVAETTFDLDRGFYDSAQLLTITTPTSGADIYYTTDGTYAEPGGQSSVLYREPLTISGTTTIRAAAFKLGFVSSNVNTRTFLFVDDVVNQSRMNPAITEDPVWGPQIRASLLSVPSVSLVTDRTIAEGMVVAEMRASVELIDPDNTEGFQVDAGMEHFGGHTLSYSSKKNIRVSFKSIYGPSSLEYPVFGDGATNEFDQLLLHSGSHDSWFYSLHPSGSWGTYIRNRWASSTQLDMGQPAPRGRFVHLYINGAYWGMYTLMERPNAAFMASYFGGDKDDYDAMNGLSPIDGDLNAWHELEEAAKANDYQQLKRYLDVENYADYMLLQFYAGNDYDWGHDFNWMAARQRAEDEGFQFFCWDSDLILRAPNANVIDFGGPGNLWSGVSKFPEFRMLLADRVKKYFFDGGLLTREHVLAKFDSLEEEVRLPLIAETARWTGTDATLPYTPDVWQGQIDRVRQEVIGGRTDLVIAQLQHAGLLPRVAAPDVQVGGQRRLDGLIHLQETVELTAQEGTILYTLDGSDPRMEGGEVSARAHVYSSAIDVTPGQILMARVQLGSQWSPLREILFRRDPSADGVSDALSLPGDSNRDGLFDQRDVVQVLQMGKFRTNQTAQESEGDWNRDGRFDRMDLVAVLKTGNYLR